MQDEPESTGTLPESAQHAVDAHADTAGEGAHLPVHSHVDDARVAGVAERFEMSVGSETPESEQA